MLATEQAMPARKYRLSVKITAGVLIVIAAAGLFETLARVVFAYREEIRASSVLSGIFQRSHDLDPYEMRSPNGLFHWVLRPGYKATRKELIAGKIKAGRDLGAGALQTEIKGLGGVGKPIFRINADGFKGPELDKTHARPRILAIGDSTTFGVGAIDYPRRLETLLTGRGIPVEVINGGVEGYSPRNLGYEIERYKALKPEIVTLYIGWNSLFLDVPWEDAWENRLRTVWLFTRVKRTMREMFNDPRTFALSLYNRDLKPDSGSPDVRMLETYMPPFMGRIERLIDEFTPIGSRIVLVTLPGLFTMSEPPSIRALKIGHLPYFTNNPYVLAKMTERLNSALRALAERRGIGLIDLEKWSVQALRPRDDFFSDSVHLKPKGLNLIGAFMAEQLENLILKNR
jgi:lysophospholipase L1-like esterase